MISTCSVLARRMNQLSCLRDLLKWCYVLHTLITTASLHLVGGYQRESFLFGRGRSASASTNSPANWLRRPQTELIGNSAKIHPSTF